VNIFTVGLRLVFRLYEILLVVIADLHLAFYSTYIARAHSKHRTVCSVRQLPLTEHVRSMAQNSSFQTLLNTIDSGSVYQIPLLTYLLTYLPTYVHLHLSHQLIRAATFE